MDSTLAMCSLFILPETEAGSFVALYALLRVNVLRARETGISPTRHYSVLPVFDFCFFIFECRREEVGWYRDCARFRVLFFGV